MLQPGTPIGRYEIQRKLARGGMGVVYVAHDPVLGRMVAIKVFLGDLDVPDAAERFGREARAAASLNHTNIVTVFDFGEVGSQPYIVMEYIQGETLAEIIRRRTSVPIVEKVRWLEEVCAGVASAHKMDVVHRDIKPGNLMVDRTGRLKILDFGIAKILNSLASSVTAVIGTPGYMAPEQLLGQPVDFRTDVFSIGVVAFEVLTFQEPFAADSFTAVTHRIINEDVRPVSDFVPEAPPELCALVDRALRKNPADRFQDAESLRVALNRVRRQLERTADYDPSSELTIIGPIAPPVGRFATGAAPQPAVTRMRTAELTPPPDPVAQREAIARARASRIQASLDRARAFVHSAELEQALEACKDALALDGSHADALQLERQIVEDMTGRRVAALLAEARGELVRGALTRTQSLLEEARQLDPDAGDAQLERELLQAHVERHREESTRRSLALAREALDAGDATAALAWAREALTLVPSSAEALAIEAEAGARLVPPTAPPAPTAPAANGFEDEQTVIAFRYTPPPAPVVPPTPSPPPLPRPTVQAPQDAVAPVRPTPVATPPTPVGAPRTATPSAPRFDVAKARAVLAQLPDRLGEAVAPLGTMARAIPRRQLQIVAAVALVLLLGTVLVAYLLLRTPAAPVTGVLIVEAVPWAEVTAITSADGTNLLATPASTPFSQRLPVGRYAVALTGPPPTSESRVLTVEVVDGLSVAPAARFAAPTVEQYFGRYFGGEAPEAPAHVAPPDTPPAGAIP